MSYVESLERLKKFQKSPDPAVSKVPKAPFETFDTAPGGRFQKSPAPERVVATSPAALAAATSDPKRTETELRIALARAAEGLPVTLPELLDAFGEQGRNDWLEGYTPHCRPEFLRAFAKAVSERLNRERGNSRKRASEAVTKVSEAPESGPLDGLPLLREDDRFIEARTGYRRDRDRLLSEYARIWKQAADGEPVEHRKANAGRRAANTWLTENTQ